ncbi:ATP synthase F1 subunit delta [Collinsella intestinalis]|uniref:ATP synthase F1 subunit delta n=1 Tax=Collinsella intestinalis TaxID=147207 RepID=UPI00195AF501|nr:ATP synthase F1 subunit delta [Collinsella intestinalis]MBM6683483.1 ATP synthase F1 subunit delta [Collinsella intestinalis]
MPTSRREERVLETYSRALIEVGKDKGRVFKNRADLEALAAASPELLGVISTMVERGQLDLLPKVAETYRAMTEEDEDVVGVTVTTAVPLDDELRTKIAAKVREHFNREVFLIEQVDPSIIGGLIIEARGERRDVSVRTQLRAAREALDSTTTTIGGEAVHV